MYNRLSYLLVRESVTSPWLLLYTDASKQTPKMFGSSKDAINYGLDTFGENYLLVTKSVRYRTGNPEVIA